MSLGAARAGATHGEPSNHVSDTAWSPWLDAQASSRSLPQDPSRSPLVRPGLSRSLCIGQEYLHLQKGDWNEPYHWFVMSLGLGRLGHGL